MVLLSAQFTQLPDVQNRNHQGHSGTGASPSSIWPLWNVLMTWKLLEREGLYSARGWWGDACILTKSGAFWFLHVCYTKTTVSESQSPPPCKPGSIKEACLVQTGWPFSPSLSISVHCPQCHQNYFSGKTKITHSHLAVTISADPLCLWEKVQINEVVMQVFKNLVSSLSALL